MTPRRPSRVGLLDVNLLIALAWPNHTHHDRARDWFRRHHRNGWATTPFTEAGFVRVSSNRAAVETATTPHLALQLLARMTAIAGHRFWVDDLTLVTGASGDSELITSYPDVTDAHLLAIAERHHGRLVTLDARIARLVGDRDPAVLDVQQPG